MFNFDRLITPKIINVLYIINLLLFLGAAIYCLFQGKVGEAFALIFFAVVSRVFFECIMIAFKNNEYLRRIAENLESR
ncbi:DUF4282 domain-containing protein [Edaphovirga cremea]|uniref:DUF4282 domain-containing protein n=1 Tax=Edaphovirga cremea TaxID=2267246 RepID=UPI000DEFC01C